VAVLLRQPLTEVLGTAAETPVPAPAAPTAPVSPLALVPVAPPTAARHEPRDPFAPLVTADQPAQGTPPTGAAATVLDTPGTTDDATSGGAETPTATAQPVASATITVQRGDTLGSLAREYGIQPWRVLYEANKGVVGSNPNVVHPGTVLIIP